MKSNSSNKHTMFLINKRTPPPRAFREVTLAVSIHLKLSPPSPSGGHSPSQPMGQCSLHLLKDKEEGKVVPRDKSGLPARFENWQRAGALPR